MLLFGRSILNKTEKKIIFGEPKARNHLIATGVSLTRNSCLVLYFDMGMNVYAVRPREPEGKPIFEEETESCKGGSLN